MGFAKHSKWSVLMAMVFFPVLLQAKEKILLMDTQGDFLSKSMLDSANKALRTLAADYAGIELVQQADLEKLNAHAICERVDTKCLRKMGKLAGAQKVLFPHAKKLPGRQMLVMKLVSVASGKTVKQSRQRVRRGRKSLSLALRKAWVSIFGRIVHCRIRVNANTENARVLLDGEERGTTPLVMDGKLLAGYHTLTVLHKDTLPSERRIVIKPGRKNLRYRFQLKLKPGDGDFALVPLVKHPVKTQSEDKVKEPGKGLKVGAAKVDAEPGKGLKVGAAKVDAEPGKGLKVGAAKVDAEPGKGLKVGAAKVDAEPGKGLKVGAAKVDAEPGKGLKVGAKTGEETKPYVPSAGEPEQPGKIPDETKTPVYKTWWFWTAVGVIAAAGIVTGTVIGLSGDGDAIPSGMGRLIIQF